MNRIAKTCVGVQLLLYLLCIPLAYGQSFPYYFTLGNTQESLVSVDHTFEGVIIPLPDERLLHFFRLDPGIMGNHVGNNGGIAKRVSYDKGTTWTNPIVIYNDIYDDRFSTGHRLDNGDIILFFRRYYCYDTWNGITEDVGMIYSQDDGETWSNMLFLQFFGPSGCFMNVFKIEGLDGYFASTYGNSYVDLRYSPDGYDWDSVYYVWDYRNIPFAQIAEPYFMCVGGGRIIGLMRVENKAIHQTVSYDYGITWTELVPTNIANGYFCPAPFMYYDQETQLLLTIATDRRGGSYSMTNLESGVWVYMHKPEQVLYNPMGYIDGQFKKRGNPNIFRMLGYPSIAKIHPYTYLVLYSDAYKRFNNLENADYYQFNIHLFEHKTLEKQHQFLSYLPISEVSFDIGELFPIVYASSFLPVTITSLDTNIAIVQNDKILLRGVGECMLEFSQEGNIEYYAAEQILLSFMVTKGTQEINFAPIEPLSSNIEYFIPSVFSSSGLPVTLISSDTSIVKISDNALIPIQEGSCVIYAIQEGNELYNPADMVYQMAEIVSHINAFNNELMPQFDVYPNPTSGFISITSISEYDSFKVTMYSIEGYVVLSEYYNSEIDLSEFDDGVYIIQIHTHDKVETHTVVLHK